MSNPNHIIIPIVKNKPTLDQLNVFQPSTLCLTPQKDQPLSRVLVDKKYNSAFKRYKQKKEKREPTEQDSPQALPSGTPIKHRKPLKLKIRHPSALDFNKNIPSSTHLLPACLFYDPNQAPLFASDLVQTPQITQLRHFSPVPAETKQEEIQVQLQQKIKAEPMDEENEMKYVEVNFRDDDAFIIIKKTNSKKIKPSRTEPTLPKTKLIKKEKNGTEITDAEKRIKVPPEGQYAHGLPVFQTSHPITLYSGLRKENTVVSHRLEPQEDRVKMISEMQRAKKEKGILSLSCIQKERSLDDSVKSQGQDQIMEPFLVAREGVMS